MPRRRKRAENPVSRRKVTPKAKAAPKQAPNDVPYYFPDQATSTPVKVEGGRTRRRVDGTRSGPKEADGGFRSPGRDRPTPKPREADGGFRSPGRDRPAPRPATAPGGSGSGLRQPVKAKATGPAGPFTQPTKKRTPGTPLKSGMVGRMPGMPTATGGGKAKGKGMPDRQLMAAMKPMTEAEMKRKKKAKG